LVTAIWAIVTFCLLVFVHELGHFLMAKKVGVTVCEFSIGMGPAIFKKQGKETLYSLRLLPIGGYVRLEGEDEKSDDEGALCNKTPFQRFLVIVSGALMNLILGFLLFVIIVSFKGSGTNEIAVINEGSPMAEAGFMAGDKIVNLELNGKSQKIKTYNDIIFFNISNGNGNMYVTVERDGNEIKNLVTPTEKDGNALYGIRIKSIDRNPVSVIKAAFNESVFMCKLVFVSLWWLISGKVPVSELSGPVGIVSGIGQAASFGIFSVLNLIALISINLGVANLLPIPALDGGRLVFTVIEMIRRKPIDAELEGKIHFIGFALLLCLMLFVTFFDIKRLFG
jgi:regulator of sigma E protease